MEKIEDTFTVSRRFQQSSARAITEQNAGCTVLVVENLAHSVAADDHDFSVHAGADELRSYCERIGESGACGGKIEAPGPFCANAVLHQAGGSGEKHIGRDAGEDN